MLGYESARPDPSAIGAPGIEVEVVRWVATGLGLGTLAGSMEQTTCVTSRGRMKVVVLRRVQRGKSTPLNASTVREVPPTGVLPLTAGATYLIRGPEQARVTDSGESVRTDPVESSTPLPDGIKGVIFVGCPGIGSPNDTSTTSAPTLFPRADAAILVLNEVDLIEPDQLAELEEYLKSVLRDRCGLGSVRLFPLSAHRGVPGISRRVPEPAGPGGLASLWQDFHPLVGPHREIVLRRLGRLRTRRFAGQLRGLIELSLHASQQTEGEYARHLGPLEKGIADVRTEHRASRAMFQDEIAALSGRFRPAVHRAVLGAAPDLTQRLDRFLSSPIGGARGQVVQRFEEALQRGVSPPVQDVRRSFSTDASNELRRIAREWVSRLDRGIVGLGELVRTEYGVEIPALSIEGVPTTPAQYSDRVERLYEGTLSGQTSLLLPSRVLRRHLRSRLPGIVHDELDARAGRLASDRLDRIDRSSDEIRSGIARQLDRNVRARTGALTERKARHAEGKVARAARLSKLEKLRDRLEEIGDTSLTAGPLTPPGKRRPSATIGRCRFEDRMTNSGHLAWDASRERVAFAPSEAIEDSRVRRAGSGTKTAP